MATEKIARYVIESDTHEFIGRLYDLALPVHLGFESYEQMQSFPDCLYVYHINESLSRLTHRVGSLNMVGDMLWAKQLPKSFSNFSISRYEWLNVIADVFLMRYISVLDCGLLLANDVFECGLDPRRCNAENLRKAGVPAIVMDAMKGVLSAQQDLRLERNSRFHHGYERALTDDDTTFKIVSLFEFRGSGMTGTDKHGRKIDLDRFLNDGLSELRQKFNSSLPTLQKQLSAFYDVVGDEFEARFAPKFRGRTKPLPW